MLSWLHFYDQKFSLFPYKFDLNLKLKLEDVYPAFVKALIGEKKRERITF